MKEADDPASIELVKLFDDQLRRWVIPRPLKTVNLGDAATIRIPEEWVFGRDGDRWRCGPEDNGPSLYVQADHVQPPPEVDLANASAADMARPYVEQILEFLASDVAAADVRTEDIADGALVQAVVDHEADDETFRTRRWYWIKGMEDGVTVVRFVLVAPKVDFSSEEIAQLISIFDHQVHGISATLD